MWSNTHEIQLFFQKRNSLYEEAVMIGIFLIKLRAHLDKTRTEYGLIIPQTVEIPGIQMFHYCGGLNFATKLNFRKEVFKAAGVVPQEELARRLKLASKEIAPEEIKKVIRPPFIPFRLYLKK